MANKPTGRSLWGGPKYRIAKIPQNDWPTKFFNTVKIGNDSTAIHIGAGGGELTKRIATAAFFTTATEFDDESLLETLKDPAFAAKGKTKFIKADPCAPPSNIPGAPFDVVFSHASLERCPNHTRLFSRFIRLAAQGGQVYFELAAAEDLAGLYETLDGLTCAAPFASYMEVFRYPYKRLSKDEVMGTLYAAGYGDMTVEQRAEPVEVSEADLPLWLEEGPAQPYLQSLPESLRGEFISETVKKFETADDFATFERSVISAHGYRLWGDLKDDLYNVSVPTLD